MAGLKLVDVVKPLPCEDLLIEFIGAGWMCAGSFPLYLAGGSETYHDIDLYARNWEDFHAGRRKLNQEGVFLEAREEASWWGVDHHRAIIQLTKPNVNQQTEYQLMSGADMSAAACTLVRRYGEWKVWVFYPEDVKNKVCRVLKKHDWTWQRIETYTAKGYTIEGA